MTVFKGYMKAALRQKFVIILYLCIFLGLGTMMVLSMDETEENMTESEDILMTVVDRDDSTLSKGLVEHLDKTQDLVNLPDKNEVLREELYYGNIQYVLIIPDGFEEALLDGKEMEGFLEGTGRPGSMQDRYIKELTNAYLNGVSAYLSYGFTPEEAKEQMDGIEQSKVEVTKMDGTRSMSKVAATLQYLPFVLIALSCYVIGFVMLDYQRQEIRRRMAVSAVSERKQTFQLMMALLVIGCFFYLVSLILTAGLNFDTVMDEPGKIYYLMNIGIMVLVGLSVALFVVSLSKTGSEVNGLANVIALGMSFICGVFIPDTMLSSAVKQVAKFLPVYWYEQNNTILGTHTELSPLLLEKLNTGYIKQILFAVAVVILSLVLRKLKEKKN